MAVKMEKEEGVRTSPNVAFLIAMLPPLDHTHSILTAIFPGEPGLAGCPLNSPSPFIPGLCILLEQA